MLKVINQFFKLESASGILLIIATILAISVENSPLREYYGLLLNIPVSIHFADFSIDKPLLLWVNDGLMVIFFLLVGLEIKREVLQGQLSDFRKILLPVFAAFGGILFPAAIYAALNWHNETAMKGWAIPAATDIAFALGVLSLLGKRVPVALKLFLMTLAIADDLGAIIIIALFYTSDLSLISLGVAGLSAFFLFALNRVRITSLSPYLLLGMVMWVAVLKSGVHATLAGVVVAFFIPLYKPEDSEKSLAEELEHDLHASVSFLILPLFAFMNTGVSLQNISFATLLESVPLGIALGLFIGKQLGVMSFSWIAVKLKFARLPEGINWWHLYGASLLAGIGFTMSLFISSLAFAQGDPNFVVNDRLGILLGSVLSAVCGYLLLNKKLSSP